MWAFSLVVSHAGLLESVVPLTIPRQPQSKHALPTPAHHQRPSGIQAARVLFIVKQPGRVLVVALGRDQLEADISQGKLFVSCWLESLP